MGWSNLWKIEAPIHGLNSFSCVVGVHTRLKFEF